MKISTFPVGILVSFALLLGGCKKSSTSSAEVSQPIDQAWQQFSLGAYDASIDTFLELSKNTKGSELQAQALYGMATVWNLRRPDQDLRKAQELYSRLIKDHPNSEFASWSALGLARIKVIVPVGQQPDWDSVRKDYQKVIDNYPSSTAAEEAFVLQQGSLLATFSRANAVLAEATLKKFISEYPDSYYLSSAHSLLADCYLVLGDHEKRLQQEMIALTVLEKESMRLWEKKNSTSVPMVKLNAAAAVFKIANIAEFDLGDFATARIYYQRFLNENPTEKRNFYARQALERMDRTEAEMKATKAGANPS